MTVCTSVEGALVLVLVMGGTVIGAGLKVTTLVILFDKELVMGLFREEVVVSITAGVGSMVAAMNGICVVGLSSIIAGLGEVK
jgi:hypothetical protein